MSYGQCGGIGSHLGNTMVPRGHPDSATACLDSALMNLSRSKSSQYVAKKNIISNIILPIFEYQTHMYVLFWTKALFPLCRETNTRSNASGPWYNEHVRLKPAQYKIRVHVILVFPSRECDCNSKACSYVRIDKTQFSFIFQISAKGDV